MEIGEVKSFNLYLIPYVTQNYPDYSAKKIPMPSIAYTSSQTAATRAL